MRISDVAIIISALALVGCSSEPDNGAIATVEADQARSAAAAGRISCALAGAQAFRQDCTMDRLAADDGLTLVLGRADAGYRRFRVTEDGRGLIAADGAESATVSVLGDGMIEVSVANDRYRLPATIKSGN